jgi:uncharacterized lipoprotein YajG
MKHVKTLIVLLSLVLTSACSTTPVDVTYAPNSSIVSATKAAPVVAIGSVSDGRKNDANWLGAIRGGFGNPIKVLETKGPVSDVVKKALVDGLASAHLLTVNDAKYALNVDVMRFDCNQYARREAHIILAVSLVNKASQQVVYSKTIKSDKVTGSIITFDAGVFASVDDLRQVANDVLQDAVDQLLSDQAFMSNLR